MRYLLLALSLFTLVGCFEPEKGDVGPSGSPGEPGKNGADAKAVLLYEESSTLCSNGGVEQTFYRDNDDTGTFTDADTILSVSNICNGSNGADGTSSAGTDGEDGHSIVSVSRSATVSECSGGGTALDIYTDLDNTLNYTSGDTLQNTLVACRGPVGPAGSNGTNSTASITTISSLTTTCVQAGVAYVRLRTSGSCDVYVYNTLPTCNGQSSRLARLNGATNEFYWTGSSQLLTVECSSTSVVTVKVINFN